MRFLREAIGQRGIVGIDDGDKIDLKLEVSGFIAADADSGLHIWRGEFQPAHANHVLQRAAKAGSVTRREKLLRIGAF